MNYYHYSDVVPHKPFKVVRKEGYKVTGEYTGYYYPSRNIVKLYPRKGSWIYGKLTVHEISIFVLRRLP